MWAAAAEATAGPDPTLITAIAGFLGVVVTTIGVVVVQAMKSRADRTAPSPPAPSTATDTALAERVAVLEYRSREDQQRDDDSDLRDDIQDRALNNHGDRLDAIERHLDRHDPGWRP